MYNFSTTQEKAIVALLDAGFDAGYDKGKGGVVIQAFTRDLETAHEFAISQAELNHWAGIYDQTYNNHSND